MKFRQTYRRAIPCEERERLEAAYHAANKAHYELEAELGKVLVSPRETKHARKKLRESQMKWFHRLKELMAHTKSHGCEITVKSDSSSSAPC